MVVGGVTEEVGLTVGVEGGELGTNLGLVALTAAAAKGGEGSAECVVRVLSGGRGVELGGSVDEGGKTV